MDGTRFNMALNFFIVKGNMPRKTRGMFSHDLTNKLNVCNFVGKRGDGGIRQMRAAANRAAPVPVQAIAVQAIVARVTQIQAQATVVRVTQIQAQVIHPIPKVTRTLIAVAIHRTEKGENAVIENNL